MVNFFRFWLAILFCGGALAVVGCTRTQDGSFEVANAAVLPSFVPGADSAKSYRDGGTALTEYPRAPRSAQEWELQRKAAQAEAWKPAAPKPQARPSIAAAASTVSCHDVTDPGGRVRVVCQ